MSVQAPPQANPAPRSSPDGVDNLTCQWLGCLNTDHPSPEALYEHVCETHIGRKSTNNLNLQCYWGACRTTTVKRDHITSHIRVHVPLKPHKCDFCGKSFKRPQDLKKHVKTHADESVLLNPPQTGAGASRSQQNGYHGQSNGKSSGFYGDGGMGQNMNYGPGYPNMQNGYAHYGNPGVQGSNYPGGGPHYGMPVMNSYAGGAVGLTETRKRNHDALNDFFGEFKRRNMDQGAYQDLGARFGNVFGMMGPMGFQAGFNSGYGGGMDNGGGVAYQAQPAPMTQPGYATQFPELRTKNDLLSIDQFLEQLQQTVYDNPAEATPGMQSVATMHHPGLNLPARSSHSPPRYSGPSAATPSDHSYAQSSTLEETPALTPSSFHASHSPSSTTQQTHSPASRPAGSVGYPTLPPFHSLESQSNQFAQGPSPAAPASGLDPQYEDYDNRRRYSGGFLQRARVSPPTREADKVESPKARESPAEKDAALAQGVKNVDISATPQSPVKLPGVAEITSGEAEKPASEADARKSASPEKEKEPPTHVQYVRFIDQVREYLRSRIERGEFENDTESGKTTPRPQHEDTEMADADADADDGSSGHGSTPKREGPSIAYPNLSKPEIEA